MKLLAASIYDIKSKSFGMPYFTPNNDTAARTFERLKQDEQSQQYHTPEDFILYSIGTFDTNTGELERQKLEIIPLLGSGELQITNGEQLK